MLLAARILAIASIIALCLFPDLTKMLLPAAAIFTIASCQWQEQWQILKANHILVVGGAILVTLFAIGMTYSEAPTREITTGFFKYTKVLYMLFLLPLFSDSFWRKMATNALILAIFLNIFIYLAITHEWFLISHGADHWGYMGYPISVSVVLGFVAFILLNRFCDEKKYRWFYAVLFLAAIYSLFFIFNKRTGQLVFLILFFLWLWQRFGRRGFLTALLVVPLTTLLLFWASSSFRTQVSAGFHEGMSYIKTQQTDDTSIADRLAFAHYSFKTIKKYPIFGAGTGSFFHLYSQTGGPLLAGGTILRDPHNEYVLITFQIGFLGLSLFLGWLIMQWLNTKKLFKEDKYLAQGVITAFVITSACNAALVVSVSGLFYVIFLSVYFSALTNE